MSFNKNIRCPDCNYCNHYEMIKLYGTCKLCGKVLDQKAKYKYEMYKKLHLWTKKKNRSLKVEEGYK